jgi:hypothetical protein|tara:strand:+ start:225 stop:656 length:432 start_codon:yes stop_codon:yes gene_type:complete
MPEASKAYANWEILQDADADITVQFNASYPIDSYTYKARIVKDYSGTAFTFGDAGSIDYIEIDQTDRTAAPSDGGGQVYGVISKSGSGTATPVITVKLYAIQTKDFPASFSGKWDLLEKTGAGVYTRQTQGEVNIDNSAAARF